MTHRRRAPWAGLALGLAGLLTAAPGCRKAKPPAEPPPAAEEEPPAAPRMTIGVLYRGLKNDGGYNQAHASAVRALADQPGVKVLEVEKVAEDEPAGKTMDVMAVVNQASLVFATGLGHFDPWLINSARKHPKTTFLTCGGHYREGLHPANAGSYFGYLEEGHYVAGVVAALTSRKKKMGFVASRAVPHVLRSINAFALGVRSVNPRIPTYVVFTDQWTSPKREVAAAEKLFAKGVDVLAMHVDAPRALIEAAEKQGVFTVGIYGDHSALAPKGFLTAVRPSWSKLYLDYAAWVRDKKPFPQIIRGGFKEGFVALAPFGPAVSEEARRRADEAKARLFHGSLVIFRGPLKDNRGQVALEAGRELVPRDVRLETIQFLVEGVVTMPLDG